MFNFFKKLFSDKQSEKTVEGTVEKHIEISLDDLFIGEIIGVLRSNPDFFSARWSTGDSIDNSVQSADRNILIASHGQILQPIKPNMSEKEMEIVRNLIIPIFNRDKIYLFEKFRSKYPNSSETNKN